jgi:hypothetical protein
MEKWTWPLPSPKGHFEHPLRTDASLDCFD